MKKKSYKFIIIFFVIIAGIILVLQYKNIIAFDVPRLLITYPAENSLVSTQNGYCYVLGQITPPADILLINGEKVLMDDDGAFLYYGKLNLEETNSDTAIGYFEFKYQKGDYKNKYRLRLNVAPILKTSPDTILVFDEIFKSEPNENLIYLPGEVLNVSVKGTPGCSAYFTIEGINQKFPMAQTHIFNTYIPELAFGDGFTKKPEKIFGIYKGHLILPKINLVNAKVTVHLISEKYGEISKTLNGAVTVNVSNQYDIAEVLESDNYTVGRTGPGLGYKLFLMKGTKAIIDGEIGGWYRLKLAEDEHIYVPKHSVKILPAGSPIPRSNIKVIRTRTEQNFVRIELGFDENLPFEVITENNQKKLRLKIFGASSDIDWIRFDEQNEIIKDIKLQQYRDNILMVEIDLTPPHLWGYYAFYEDNTLVIKIKKPPHIEKKFLFWGSSLANRKIVIDPGHNPEYGAIGPRKSKEKDINLKISLKLKEILEDKGAKVFFTHTTDPLPLTERKAKVLSFEPDVSISVHNNAVPDGVDPVIHNGFSVYYYNSNARLLAKSIHKSFFKNLNIVDFGLYWDNLYMCRIHETISILVEPSFIIHPEQEKNLLSESYQTKIAEAIAEGLEDFFEEIRD